MHTTRDRRVADTKRRALVTGCSDSTLSTIIDGSARFRITQIKGPPNDLYV